MEVKDIEINEMPELANLYNVTSVPYILYIEGSKQRVYSGDRSATSFLDFVKNV